MIKKRFLALGLILAMVFSLAACGGGQDGETTPPANTNGPAETEPQDSAVEDTQGAQESEPVSSGASDETLKMAVAREATEFTGFGGTGGAYIANALYDNLIFYNSQTNEYEPMLAESWETIDEKTMRYHLVQNAVTTDGSPITANDVLYTFKFGFDYDPADYSFYDVENFNVIDDYTIDIVTFEPYSGAFTALASTPFGIMSEAVTEANGGYEGIMTNPVNGSGAYKFVSYTMGESIILERNENYYGEAPYYKTVEIYFIEDATTRSLALESGDVDLIETLDTALAPNIEAIDGLSVVPIESASFQMLSINCTQKPFDDLLVRKAIACAINKDAIAQVAFSNYAVPVSVLLPEKNPLYVEIDHPYTYDVEQAKSYLSEAGYADGGITMRLMCGSNYQSIAQVIQSNLAEIGITVELDLCDMQTWSDRAANEPDGYDATIGSFFSGNDTQPFYTMDASRTREEKNWSQCPDYGVDNLEELLAGVYQTSDLEKAKEYSKQLLEIYNENVTSVALVSSNTIFGARDFIDGYYTTTKGDVINIRKLIANK